MIFFFNDTATTEIYTLSLHDALPIYAYDVYRQTNPWAADAALSPKSVVREMWEQAFTFREFVNAYGDRKSTRLNSSHANISYAVFCLKKKKNQTPLVRRTTDTSSSS